MNYNLLIKILTIVGILISLTVIILSNSKIEIAINGIAIGINICLFLVKNIKI